MTTTNTDAAFQLPRTQAVCTYAGHAYGKAGRTSTCPFTGMRIDMYEAIREVDLTTRDGRQLRAYTSNRIFGLLGFMWDGENTVSTYAIPGKNWAAHRDAVIDNLDNLGSVEVLRMDGSVKAWVKRDDGRWSTGRSQASSKQLAAALRATKNAAGYRTSPAA